MKMKYLQYHEPCEDDKDKFIRVSGEQVINKMNEYASRRGFVYKNDQEAIDDFIAVNWAYWVEVEE